MKDIKFRVWDLQLNKYRSPGTIQLSCTGKIFLLVPNGNKFTIERIENLVLQQFTGLTDKNGVEIYEGDIVRDIIVGLKSKIVFTDYANFGLKSNYIKDLEYDIIDPSWSETSLEVIGNIHENPELL